MKLEARRYIYIYRVKGCKVKLPVASREWRNGSQDRYMGGRIGNM